jgi:hypothetical protein
MRNTHFPLCGTRAREANPQNLLPAHWRLFGGILDKVETISDRSMERSHNLANPLDVAAHGLHGSTIGQSVWDHGVVTNANPRSPKK